jgi:hypothetical protein
VGHRTEAYVGIDTSKSCNAIAIADGGRGGEVRYLGDFPATEAAIPQPSRLVRALGGLSAEPLAFTKPPRLDKNARPHALFTVAGFFLRLGITALAISRLIDVTGQSKVAE